MNSYIFLASSLHTPGGAPLYMAEKARVLTARGWKVRMFAFTPGSPLDFLAPYSGGYLPELEFPYHVATPAVRRRAFRNICSGLFLGDTVVVESCNPHLALWGEALAAYAGGRHIAFMLNEVVRDIPVYRPLLRHKLADGALFGIFPGSVNALFPDADPDASSLLAIGCGLNPKSDAACPGIDSLPDADLSILLISRLEKPSLRAVVSGVGEFCSRFPNRSFRLVLVGGTPYAKASLEISAALRAIPNLRALMTGALSPIPQAVFRASDLFVGNSGALFVAAAEHLPCIAVDASGASMGIYGQDTDRALYPDSPSSESLADTIARFFAMPAEARRAAGDAAAECVERTLDREEGLRRHISLLSSPAGSSLFSADSVRPHGFIHSAMRFLLRLGAFRSLLLLKEIKRNLKAY